MSPCLCVYPLWLVPLEDRHIADLAVGKMSTLVSQPCIWTFYAWLGTVSIAFVKEMQTVPAGLTGLPTALLLPGHIFAFKDDSNVVKR